jgi:uridine kinase
MLFIAYPAAVVAKHFGLTAGSMALLLTFLIMDFLIAYILIRIKSSLEVVALWVAGPLTIYITYVHGQTDVVVGGAILIALLAIRADHWKNAAIAIGVGASFKLSVLLILPFIFIFAIKNPRFRSKIIRFFILCISAIALGLIPAIYSSGFRKMVLMSQEAGGLFDYSLSLGRAEPFLIVPVVYIGMLYALWRRGRSTIGVLAVIALSGIACVVLFAPSSVGWYLWFLPGLLGLRSGLSSKSKTLIVAMQIGATFVALIERIMVSDPPEKFFEILNNSRVLPLVQTLTLCCGVLLIVSFLRKALVVEDPFNIGHSPLSVGIAGDSGAGKNTLVDSIMKLFPIGMCQSIEGDDYHLYERGAPEWTTLTHLNPLANDLGRLRKDAVRARSRQLVSARSYDHQSGKFKSPRITSPGDFLIVNGLHSLYIEHNRDVFDLRVFLSMDETLREKFKISRDFNNRGASSEQIRKSLAQRAPDAERYVNVQKNMADIEIHLEFQHGDMDKTEDILCAFLTHGFIFPAALSRAMSSISLIPHTLEQGKNVGDLELRIDASGVNELDVTVLADYLLPNFRSFFDSKISFPSGNLGVETLVIFLALDERRGQFTHA